MVKVLVFTLVAYALYRLFMNDHRKKEDELSREREQRVAAGEMARDPVCGTYVDAEGGITVRNGETVFHFCSYECREKYIRQLREQGQIES
ncbi:MAG: transcriptional regulator [Desulfovibrionaceae bacterium]|nr:transcriptional regulator [Desulfovibrionaceae bacterium]